MKNAKRIISILLSLLIVFGTVAIGGYVASADDAYPEVSSWEELGSALQAGGSIILTADVAPDDPYWADALTVPSGVTAYLDLNGHIVDRGYRDDSTEIWDGSIIEVEGELHIFDSNPTADHSGATDYIDPLSGNTVSVTGGVLTGAWPDQYGGVYVGNGIFILESGTICGNRVGKVSSWGGDGLGAGVYIQNGTFIMTGGSICYNRAVGESTIMGSAMGKGGGVYVANGTFEMEGGTITGNEAGLYGGGVYFASTYSGHDSTELFLGGDAQITGNTVDGAANNVYLEEGGKIKFIKVITGTVGVTMMTPGVFTGGFVGNGDPENFTSDDIHYAVSLTDMNEAQLVDRPIYTVTVTADENITKTEDSGDATQAVDIGSAMTDVVYTANYGYYFPEDYSVDAVNGVTVTRDSFTQITVSGTPVGNTEITLAAPTAKTTPEMTVTVTPENPVSDGSFTLTVNLPDDAAGNVIIRFNEVDLLGYIQLANGNSQDFNCLQSGTYSGTAKYMPDENSNYEEVTVEFSFNVSAAAPNMTLTADDITYGETASVTANLPTDTMWGSVTFYLDGADTGKEVYVSQGKAVCTFAGLNAGEHTVEAVFANDDKYADETKTVTFNVEQKELTITANDQTYPFNGQIQGEGNTTYEDPAEIAEKVTVEGLVAGDSLASIILDGQAKNIGEHEGVIAPSSAVIKNSGGQDVTANYNITYKSGKLTITSVNAPLTINYVYAKGGEAAETHTEDVEIFTGYSVTSPEITGYTPDKETVEGTMENLDGVTETVTYIVNTYKATYIVDGEEFAKFDVDFGQSVPKPRTPQKEGYKFAWIDEIPETMPAEDITVNGAFTPIEYTAKFVDENGETVEEVPYTVETQSITEPDVPEKQGYFGEWENYTLAIGGVTVKPVYRNTTSIELEGYTESSESGYKEDRTFTAKAENLPEGAEIHWFVNGEDVGTGDICTVEDPTDDYTVQAKVIDKDGNTLDETKVQPVKVKNGFFDRLKAFFAELIEKILGKAIADLLGSVC